MKGCRASVNFHTWSASRTLDSLQTKKLERASRMTLHANLAKLSRFSPHRLQAELELQQRQVHVFRTHVDVLLPD